MAKSFRVQIQEVQSKIAALTAALEVLQEKASGEVDYAAVQAGVGVTFNYGKAPNVRVMDGMVLGRKDPEAGAKGGALVRIAVGEGYEAQILTVYPQAVTKIHSEVLAQPA